MKINYLEKIFKKNIFFIFLFIIFDSHFLFSSNINKLKMVNVSESMSSLFFLHSNELKKKLEIYESSKLNENASWEKPQIVSDQSIDVSEDFKIKKDKEGNIVIAWMGINPDLANCNFYANIFLRKKNKWIGPFLISDPKDNLTRNFSINNSDRDFMLTWFSYDDNFNVIIHSRQFTQEKDWGEILQIETNAKFAKEKKNK